MTDTAIRPSAGSSNLNAAIVAALRETAVTVVLVFLLSIYMVGFHTVAQQGQPLGYTTRFSDVIWACILVSAGRFVVSLDRQGFPRPALTGGGIGFLYLFGVGMLGISASAGYDTFPHPFEEPMVN